MCQIFQIFLPKMPKSRSSVLAHSLELNRLFTTSLLTVFTNYWAKKHKATRARRHAIESKYLETYLAIGMSLNNAETVDCKADTT